MIIAQHYGLTMHFNISCVKKPKSSKVENAVSLCHFFFGTSALCSYRSLRLFMQVKASRVEIVGSDGEKIVYEDESVLLGDYGLFVKTNEKLALYSWERVAAIEWTDGTAMKKVWADAITDMFEDLLDEDDGDWDDEPAEVVEKKDESTTPSTDTGDTTGGAENSAADNPEHNPYE